MGPAALQSKTVQPDIAGVAPESELQLPSGSLRDPLFFKFSV